MPVVILELSSVTLLCGVGFAPKDLVSSLLFVSSIFRENLSNKKYMEGKRPESSHIWKRLYSTIMPY